MVEFYYWRESGGRSRPECVVLFLPDVWSAQTPRLDWSDVQEKYKATGDAALAALDADQSGELPEISQIVCSQFCLVQAATERRLLLMTRDVPELHTVKAPKRPTCLRSHCKL